MQFSPLKRAALLFSVVSFAAAASAATVTVTGTATVPGVSYQKLSEAIAYTNSQGAGPHTINIMVNSLNDDTIAYITQPVTINGDGNTDSTPCTILIDIAQLIAQPNYIPPYKAWMQIASPGEVVVQDIRLHPDEDGTEFAPVGAIATDNPPSGVSNYTLRNIKVSGSNAGLAYLDPVTDADLYEDTANVLWFPTDTVNGVIGGNIHITSTTETAGDYDITVEDCHVAMAYGNGIGVSNRRGAGKTEILGGLFAHVAKAPILVTNSEGVTVRGTYENRVQLLRGNKNNGGSGLTLHGGSIVDVLEYIDSYLHEAGAWNFVIDNSTATLMQHCRLWHGVDPTVPTAGTGGRLMRIIGVSGIDARSCTLFVDNTLNTPGDGNNNEDFNVTFTDAGGGANGEFLFTDCVFASDGPQGANASDGYFILRGPGLRKFDYCGLPTDAYMPENIQPATAVTDPQLPLTKGPNVEITTETCVFVSPHFSSVTYSVTDPSNPNFLLPTDAAYDAAASDGTKLVGGVGTPTNAAVNDWMLMEDRRRPGITAF